VQEDSTPAGTPDEEPSAVRQMPLGIVIARILVVSGMSFAAAFAIFFLVGGLWLPALVSIAATLVFLLLMFAIERGAESHVE
jgi:Na+/serine symporter